jgi:iron complex outermembrane receptor protein
MASSAMAVMLPTCAGAQTANDAKPNTTGIETIVVTAERRSENLQKSSLQISVLSGDELAKGGVTEPQDLNTVVSGLQLSMAGPVAQPYVRGVGNADNTGFAVSGLAFNLDGVYIAQPVAYTASMFDINRLEVLKGPQGTLYGRNATGGAINIITNEPGDTFGGYLETDVNNYGLARLDGAADLPVSDTLAMRAAFYVDDRSGYFKDGTGDDKSEGGRLKFKWDPNADLTVRLNLEYDHDGGDGPGAALDIGPTYNVPHPWEGMQGPNSIPYVLTSDPYAHPKLDENVYSVGGQIDWRQGDFTFTLIPNYRFVDFADVSYSDDQLFAMQSEHYSETTVEGRVAYDSDNFKWVGGLYFYNEDQKMNWNFDFDYIHLYTRVPALRTQSYAAFTQGTYSLTESFRVIAGVRYSHELQDGHGSNQYVSPPYGTLPYADSVASAAVNYKAGIEYDLAPQNMVYANVSTGYKAGGWFPSPSGPLR